MSVTFTTHNKNTIWNFLEDSYGGPNWTTVSIGQDSSATQLICNFSFEGQAVSFILRGSFPENPASFSTLGALANQSNVTVSGYELSLDGSLMDSTSISPATSLSLTLTAMSGTNQTALQQFYAGNDIFNGSNTAHAEDDDGVNGYAGNDTFTGYATSGSGSNTDKFYGGDGVDTLVLRGKHSEYTISPLLTNVWMPDELNGFGRIITDKVSGRDGTKSERYVERLQFSDKNVAIDVDSHALQTLEFIGVVAQGLQNNLAIRGVILNLFDQPNQTMESLCQTALNLNLIAHSTSAELAKAVYSNVTRGGTASTAMTDLLVNYIDSHSQANFMATVANMHINVDLVGLNNLGMEYSPVL